MPKNMAKNKRVVKKRIEAQFKKLDQALEKSNPGLTEMLHAYGVYEASLRQADAFLSALNPVPVFSASDRSSL